MNSETSTEPQTLPPWQFFTLAALFGATVVVLAKGGVPSWLATRLPDSVVRLWGVSPEKTSASIVILLSLTIFAAAVVAVAVARTLAPLAGTTGPEAPQLLGGRTRAGLDREKTLALRTIKELEFDRAMGKVSEKDFAEMSGRLRARAGRLLRQLDLGTGYRQDIEQEMERRLRTAGVAIPAATPKPCACGTVNDTDARFCKACGAPLGATA